jgi:hypothetical protein
MAPATRVADGRDVVNIDAEAEVSGRWHDYDTLIL